MKYRKPIGMMLFVIGSLFFVFWLLAFLDQDKLTLLQPRPQNAVPPDISTTG